MLRESVDMVSPLSVLYYEEYDKLEDLKNTLTGQEDKLQCIIGDEKNKISTVLFGEAQNQEVWDYADGVDTLKFLEKIY